VQRTVARYDGLLTQLVIGDKGSYGYAIFGAPVSHDDDAARAVAAALELRQAAPPAAGTANLAQIGICQGMTRSGIFGGPTRWVYGAMGDQVNLAARLMALAAPGQILCDDRVQRQARRRWAFQAGAPVRARGKAHYTRTYEPTGNVTEHPHPAIEACRALAGRANELARIEQALDALLHGHTGVLLIEGEAGIGKSRLVAEAIRLVRERGLSGLIGAGRSMEQHTAYRPWRDMFSAYFALQNSMSAAERRARVQSQLREILPEAAERMPLLNDLLGLGTEETDLTRALDPQLRSRSLGALLIQLMQAWAREQPLVLVLEDAHWFDSLSWELALGMLQAFQAAALRALVLVTSRPLDAAHPGLAGRDVLLRLPGAARISLDALARDDILALVAERLGLSHGDIPASVAAIVCARAGGNPFYAEELVDALRDQGAIRVGQGQGSRCVAAPSLAHMASVLPDTVHELILARIDRLPPDEQLTLKVAAVVGTTFSYPPLLHARRQAAAQAPELRSQLRQLAAENFTLLEAPDPDLAYRFRHVLTQEAAYGTLLFEQRRALHRSVAEWYEALGATDDPALATGAIELPRTCARIAGAGAHLPLLAHHYHYAEDAERERYYAFLAGIQAADQYANAEAIQFFSRALELTPGDDHTRRYEILVARLHVFDLAGARAEQRRDLEELERIGAALGDPQHQAEIALLRLALERVVGDADAAVQAGSRAAALARAAHDLALEARACLALGTVLPRRNEFAAGLEQLERALGLARQLALRAVEADTLRARGLLRWYQSDYDATVADVEQSAAIYREIGERRGQAEALDYLGNVASQRGNFVYASSAYQQSLDLSRAIGDRTGEAWALFHLGTVIFEGGDPAGGRDLLEQALVLFQATDGREGQGWTLGTLGRVAFHQSAFAEADNRYTACLETFRSIRQLAGEGWALTNLGCVAVLRGRYADAERFFAEQQQMIETTNNQHDRAFSLIDQGNLALATGQLDRASACFERALAICHTLGVQRAETHALDGQGRVAAERGALAEAIRLYRRGLALAQSLGHPLLEARAHLHLGAVLRDCGAAGGALDHSRRAHELFEASGNRHGAALAGCQLACLLAVAGDSEALGQAAQAAGVLEALDTPPDAAQALAMLGHAHMACGSAPVAATAFERALRIRRELRQHSHVPAALAALVVALVEAGAAVAARRYLAEVQALLAALSPDQADFPALALAYLLVSDNLQHETRAQLAGSALDSIERRARSLGEAGELRLLDSDPIYRALVRLLQQEHAHESC
jgi:predicted ATPase